MALSEAQKRYAQSDKGKAARAKYMSSPKAKEARKIYMAKRAAAKKAAKEVEVGPAAE